MDIEHGKPLTCTQSAEIYTLKIEVQWECLIENASVSQLRLKCVLSVDSDHTISILPPSRMTQPAVEERWRPLRVVVLDGEVGPDEEDEDEDDDGDLIIYH